MYFDYLKQVFFFYIQVIILPKFSREDQYFTGVPSHTLKNDVLEQNIPWRDLSEGTETRSFSKTAMKVSMALPRSKTQKLKRSALS